MTAKADQLKAVKDKRDIWFSFVKVVMQKQFVIQVTSGTDFQELYQHRICHELSSVAKKIVLLPKNQEEPSCDITGKDWGMNTGI